MIVRIAIAAVEEGAIRQGFQRCMPEINDYLLMFLFR
jgi:hypothetical protein